MLKVTFSWVTTTSPSKTHKPYKNHTTAKLPYLDRIDWESTIVAVLLCTICVREWKEKQGGNWGVKMNAYKRRQ